MASINPSMEIKCEQLIFYWVTITLQQHYFFALLTTLLLSNGQQSTKYKLFMQCILDQGHFVLAKVLENQNLWDFQWAFALRNS